jgi:hypothetical protein
MSATMNSIIGPMADFQNSPVVVRDLAAGANAGLAKGGPMNAGPVNSGLVNAGVVVSRASRRALCEADAVDIWIARWLRIRRKDLLARYGCDPRRLYEVWEESRFSGARAKAITLFTERYPGLVDRIDYGRHHRVPRAVHPDQLSLFE